jgi:glycosyltransferase involved in cell wall biosynthesis
MKILILIPAYNAGRWLNQLIERMPPDVDRSDILIVDDGSTDDTLPIAQRCGVSVTSHGRNLGKGAALKTGFDAGISRGYDLILTLDADLQHPPEWIPLLARPILAGEADLVIGARSRQETSMSSVRRFSNALTSALISWRVGQKIPDSQSGFRAIRSGILKEIQLTTSRYETETELLIKAADRGFRIGHVPIPTIYAGETSSIRHVVDTCRFIRLFIKLLFERSTKKAG